jgi:predicted nucleic acid-binding protein
VRAIADTGFLVAFGDRRDHHRWAAEIAEFVTESLSRCEAVLAETAFHLASSRGRREAIPLIHPPRR